MVQDSKTSEMNAVLRAAEAMCAAARTAPKGKGVDYIDTLILTGEDIEKLAATSQQIGEETGAAFFVRDAGNLRASQAVVLIGVGYQTRGLNEICGLCNFENCAKCAEAGAVCVHAPMDLGIAIGSAVSVAADMRMDNRVMFSAGQSAMKLKLFAPSIKCVIAIPLSVSGKSPYFDRK